MRDFYSYLNYIKVSESLNINRKLTTVFVIYKLHLLKGLIYTNAQMKAKNIKKQTLSREEVLRLADLVKLELSEEEIVILQEQLGETIDYIQNLNELDTDGVKETSHTTNSHNVTFIDGAPSTRTFTQKEATINAKRTRDGYFIVTKILDK